MPGVKNGHVLAFDFGASSGRAMLGSLDGGRLKLAEIHRFTNEPVQCPDGFYWDVLRLFHEMKEGIRQAGKSGIDSVGVDTWGVDFALLDETGALISNPLHYRDPMTVGMMEEAFETLSADEIYRCTGIEFIRHNSVFQLLALRKYRPALFACADKMLMMADYFGYLLTGNIRTEYTVATTTQLIDAESGTWSRGLLDAFSLSESLLAPMILPGEKLGELRPDLCAELGIPAVPVMSVASHDTASAVVAVPTCEENFIFISCGTWSLIGTVTEHPVINEKTARYNLTNEGGFGRSNRLMKNIMGLWLVQESRRYWNRQGQVYCFADLERLAVSAPPFRCFIQPDDPVFSAPGNIPEHIREYCRNTGQPVPEGIGEIVRCIYESLALKYRQSLEMISDATGTDYPVIHMLGGGSKDDLLCRMTANACGRTVAAGPEEATVVGNIAVQLLALGKFASLQEARAIISDSFPVTWFQPEEKSGWDDAYRTFLELQET